MGNSVLLQCLIFISRHACGLNLLWPSAKAGHVKQHKRVKPIFVPNIFIFNKIPKFIDFIKNATAWTQRVCLQQFTPHGQKESSHMSLLNVGALTAFTLFFRLPTRCNLAAKICSHIVTRVLQRCVTNWALLYHTKVLDGAEVIAQCRLLKDQIPSVYVVTREWSICDVLFWTEILDCAPGICWSHCLSLGVRAHYWYHYCLYFSHLF